MVFSAARYPRVDLVRIITKASHVMKFRLILAVLGLLLIAFTAACGPEPQIRSDDLLRDNSFLTGDPCGPPCWRNIIPGQTNWQNALTIIEDDPTLDRLQTRADEESSAIAAGWAQVDGEGCCQMFTEDGSTVSFVVLQTRPDHTLGEVIAEHGEPAYVIGEAITGDQGLFNLFYPDTPMIIYVFIAGEQGELSPTSEVVGFAYMTETLMDELLTTYSLHAWEGYLSLNAYQQIDFAITAVPEESD